MRRPDRSVAVDLLAFVADSPSPFHAAAAAVDRLASAGFTEVPADGPWDGAAGGTRRVLRVGGTVVAWLAPTGPVRAFRLIGAHTDSPNLRIKPRPDRRSAGVRQLGVEVYGGVLLNSWLDRDLGLSGRVTVRGDGAVATRLFRIDRPLLRIPQLAIHLDRDVNDRGLVLNRQAHLSPIWGLGEGPSFRDVVADAVGATAEDVLAWDVMLHDLEPPRLLGLDEELVSSPRIDNLASCHAALEALRRAAPREDGVVTAIVLFDHEEVGSTTERGAAGGFLGSVLERIAAASGTDRTGYLEALARSVCVSADCAHATHPNYPERHEPDHQIRLNEGPVIKLNTSARYATDATTAAVFLEACRAAAVPSQWFVTRSDLACGSTIGPLTAAQLGMATVDVGIAQLAMHSCRELCGSDDPAWFVAALAAFLAG
jgi:aspartyl aminopeptidase